MPWDLVTDTDGNALEARILAVHAALLPSNQVLLFGGSEHSFDRFSNFKGGIPLLKSQLFHLSSSLLSSIEQSPDTDLFCAGHAFMGDGRLLVAGGTKDWPISFYEGAPEGEDNPNPHDALNHWDGEHACWVYNHWQGRWVRVRDLAFEPNADNPDAQFGGGRWYPTLITLADGGVIALSGHPGKEHTVHEHINPETYSAGKDEWDVFADREMNFQYSVYPRGHLLADSRIFFASPNQNQQCGIYDPATGDFEAVTTLPDPEASRISERDFSTVMLPLLPGDNYRARILAAGWADRALRITVEEGSWQQAGNRDWGAPPERINGCAVLLPTGQVALVGGVNRTESDGDLLQLDSGAVLRSEIYTPGISWSNEQYDFSDETWETDPAGQAAQVPRNYHSGALLIPDGRIITVGSNINSNTGHPDDVAEKRIEMYRPWYFDQNGRPQITDAPSSVTYNQNFTIGTPDAESIERVALMRLGSVTHSFDADQRYVGLQVINRTNNTITVRTPPNGGVAPPAYYMLWIVNDDGLPCQQAPFIKLGHQGMFFVLDRSSISIHDVQSMLASGNAQFQNAIYVVMQGVAPNDFTPPTLTATMDTAVGDPAEDFGIHVPIADVMYDIGQEEGDTAQRVTFAYNLRFDDASVFETFEDQRVIHLRAQSGAAETQATIQLHRQPNPFMVDGDEFWLSTDLRVFSVVEDDLSSLPLPVFPANKNPLQYLSQLLEEFDQHEGPGHPFDSISEDQEDSKLELARSVPSGGFPWPPWPFEQTSRVYNFAIARVRYRSLAAQATNVRVFFRLFNTVGTALEFDTEGTYRRSGDGPNATPLIGKDGTVILSIPYFGSSREDYSTTAMEDQDDPANRKTLEPTGGQESQTYFGCWLDFNQTTPRLPLRPSNDGPFGGDLLSLQQLTRGYHQCLVSEIHFGDDLIPNRTTPSRSDKLSQRNLWVEEAPNPGISPDSRTVLATCEIKSTRAAASPTAAGQLDELMIQWNNLPRNSRVTLFLPSVEAADLVSEVAIYHGGPVLKRVDEHTIELRVADVTYVPIPRLPSRTIPGLFRVELPEGIVKGQVFRVQVYQISDQGVPRNAPRNILGGFQLTIPVRVSAEVLPRLIHRYSVLKHVALSIPEDDRWYPIYKMYLDETGNRISGLGQDPNKIEPSPDGTGVRPDTPTKPDTGDPVCPKPPVEGGKPATGKVVRLIYDCYGDFTGFVLDTCPGKRTFLSREERIHRLIRLACDQRWRITVIPMNEDECAIVQIEVHC